MVSRWLDIGPNEFLASGQYNVNGTRLVLTFTKIEKGREAELNWLSDLHVVWGDIQRKGYVTGFKVFAIPGSDWDKLQHGEKDAKFMVRKVPYNDWEKILRELQK